MNRVAIRKTRTIISHNHLYKDLLKNVRFFSNTGKDAGDQKDEPTTVPDKLSDNEGVTKVAAEKYDYISQRKLSQSGNRLDYSSKLDLENSSNVVEGNEMQAKSGANDNDQDTASNAKRDENEKHLTGSNSNEHKQSKHTSSDHTPQHPHTVVESIGEAVNATKQQAVNYSGELNKAYSEMEHNIMKGINETNQRRFRLLLLSSTLFILWVGIVFGSKIRRMLSDQTAGLAKETLENESLKLQTQELAMAVVQTVLNDKEVTAHAASFLREASVVPETQQALLELTLHILQHPDSLRELSTLVKKLIELLANDKETIQQVAGLLKDALEDPKLKAALVQLVGQLCLDPAIVRMTSELTVKILQEPDVVLATNKLLMASTQTVLSDEQIITQSKDFVADVMGDDTLQREGGDAIWNSVTHAVKPWIIRIAGVTLVCASLVIGKAFLSPF
mmetsp:Transcript_4810/g.4968  ORF Transcript_4810/g.4968 Transcript_4810/m.4968 type:complete len:448 (-) Transcript_4810:11-1354(-)|eukprot:CAMPEP_0119038214 /NCGR_PEP_ID=MMETSP1177-20130426/6969_1 /TAXON_ID=2985 /ORGANISM="Ochromonas sp, Strain CCMP1899" /LENGTH=447 /DNA_ID=CAMNT_0007000457 /DNA_START=73 /DNA_END=1416 /DNA_ORIENTATION=+